MQDPRVGLGEAAALGGDDGLEERVEPGGLQARALDAVDPVRDHAQPVAPAEALERAAAAGQPVAPGREVVEEGLPEASGPTRVPLEMDEELAEALVGQVGLADRPAAVLLPERVVDPPVGGQDAGREREAEVGEGGAEGGPLGAVEVEERVIDVEEDGAEAGQDGLSGGGYLAR